MTNPREILNELKWKKGCDISLSEIWYVHRGAPNDTMIIPGRGRYSNLKGHLCRRHRRQFLTTESLK